MILSQWHRTISQMIIHNENCFVKVCIDKANPLWMREEKWEKESHMKAKVNETGQAWDWNSITNVSLCFCYIAYESLPALPTEWFHFLLCTFSFIFFCFSLTYKMENEMRAHYSVTIFQRNTCVEHARALSIQLVLCQIIFYLNPCTAELNGWKGERNKNEMK